MKFKEDKNQSTSEYDGLQTEGKCRDDSSIDLPRTISSLKTKIKVTRKMQEELNEVKRNLGFEEDEIKDDYELECIIK